MDFSAKVIDLGVLLIAFWGLLKWTISRELKNIYSTMDREFKAVNSGLARVEKQGDGHSTELRDMHGRVSALEAGGVSLGRRKTDHCPAPDCPWETSRGGGA